MQLAIRQRILVAVVLAAGLGMSSGARSQDESHLTGVIIDHGKPGTVMVQTEGSSTPMTLVVDDFTKVRRSGMFKSEKLSSNVLQPGLRIKAEGTYENATTFVARRITVTK